MEFNDKSRQHSSNLDNKEIDSAQRDCFELLSAYLDGEVTPAERKQVHEWLDYDPEIQHLYQRLLKLRQRIHSLPIPASDQSVAEMPERVFQRIRQRRLQKAALFGGGAIAAAFISAITGIVPGNFVNQMAQMPDSQLSSEPLMVAINRPPVAIPKAAVVISEQEFNASEYY